MVRAKLILIVILLGTSGLSAKVWSQHERMTLKSGSVNMVQLFEQLQKQTNLRFVFNKEDVERYRVDIDVEDKTLEEVLNTALAGKQLQYKFTGQHVIISHLDQQDQSEHLVVKGVARGANGRALAGVTVRVKDSNRGVSTDASGRFSLNVTRQRNTETTLVFSFIGYETQEISFTENREITVAMKETATDIEQVVVTGIFNKPADSYTGSATQVSKRDLEQNWSNNMLQTLGILEPSMRILENNAQGSNPNAMPDIQIRGASTMSTDFTQLRNQSQQGVNLPLIIYDGFEITLERFMDLNLDDVEYVSILKDASATALYGSRGANGVIVITPSVPVAGKLRVTYTGQLKIEIPSLDSYNLVNAQQKLELEALAGLWDVDPKQYEYWLDRVVNQGKETDWTEIPTRTGYGQVHRLSINGGEQAYRFNVNLSFDDTQGVMKGSYRKNFNGTINLSYTKGNFYVNNAFSANLVNAQESPYGDFSQIVSLNPYWTPYDDDGIWNMFFYPIDPLVNRMVNPIYNGSLASFDKTRNTVLSNNIQMRYTLWNTLRIEGRVGLARSIAQKDNFKSPLHTDFWETGDEWKKGSYTKGETVSDKYDISLTLNYGETLGEKHILNAGLNWRITGSDSDQYSMIGVGFINENLNHISNATNYQETVAAGSGPKGTESIRRGVEVVGTVNYNYDMRYFVDASLRFDGNSTFGRNSAWSTYWAVGAGWTISKEKFLENARFLDLLRVKYSYGVSGSMNFSPYQGNYVYGYQSDKYYRQWLGTTLLQFGNEDLNWQNTYQHNVALDLQLFDQWVEVNAAYYNKLTTNAVSDLPLSLNHGYERYTGNMGKIRNEGWEVSVGTYIVRNPTWQLNVRGRFAGNINTIVKLSDEMKRRMELDIQDAAFGADFKYIYREGHSLDALYVVESLGVDPVSGRRVFINNDGNPTFSSQTNYNRAFVYVGNKLPKANGSITALASYKNLTLTLGFQFRWGGKTLNSTVLSKVENVDWSRNVDRRVYTDRWRNPGDVSLYKSIELTDYTYGNTEFVQTDNTFQWMNCNISYYVSPDWLYKNLRLRSMTLTAYLSDIWYNSTIKRERGTSYPYSINPNFQISFSF